MGGCPGTMQIHGKSPGLGSEPRLEATGQSGPGQKYQSRKSGISYFQAPTAQMLVSDFKTYLIEILNASVS